MFFVDFSAKLRVEKFLNFFKLENGCKFIGCFVVLSCLITLILGFNLMFSIWTGENLAFRIESESRLKKNFVKGGMTWFKYHVKCYQLIF